MSKTRHFNEDRPTKNYLKPRKEYCSECGHRHAADDLCPEWLTPDQPVPIMVAGND